MLDYLWRYRNRLYKALQRVFSGERSLVLYIYSTLNVHLPQERIFYLALTLYKMGIRLTSIRLILAITSHRLNDKKFNLKIIREIICTAPISTDLLPVNFFRTMLASCQADLSDVELRGLFLIRDAESVLEFVYFLRENQRSVPQDLQDIVDKSEICLLETFHAKSIFDTAHEVIDLLPAQDMSFYDPSCFEQVHDKKLRSIELQAQSVAVVKDVFVISGFQLVKDNNWLIYERAGDPRDGFVSNIWDIVKVVGSQQSLIVRFFYKTRRTHDSGILLCGRSSLNYFHWLIEYIPRLVNILAMSSPSKAPLLIDKNLLSQQKEFALFLGQKYGYPLLELDLKDLNFVKTLYVPSFATHIPDDPKYEYWESAGMRSDYLLQLQEWGWEYLKSVALENPRPVGGKFYISRRGNLTRGITNEAEIEECAVKNGFEVVFPEKLSFAEQIDLFYSADVIVSPAGAAFANVVFCRKGTRVFSLVANLNREYAIVSNLCAAVGCEFQQVTGEIAVNRENFASFNEYRYSFFKMDIEKMDRLFKSS